MQPEKQTLKEILRTPSHEKTHQVNSKSLLTLDELRLYAAAQKGHVLSPIEISKMDLHYVDFLSVTTECINEQHINENDMLPKLDSMAESSLKITSTKKPNKNRFRNQCPIKQGTEKISAVT